jgi:hypothetical protein
MAELITTSGRKAIIKIAEISQLARALSLMPKPEDFALRFIGELKNIARMINNIILRINAILDRYTSIPAEFFLKGFDEILEKLNDINDYAKFTIGETASLMSSTIKSTQELTSAFGDATSSLISATLQVGGGLGSGVVGITADIKLASIQNDITDDLMQKVINGEMSISEMQSALDSQIDNEVGGMYETVDNINNWTTKTVTDITESIGGVVDDVNGGLDDANNWINDQKQGADTLVDNTVGELIKKVEKAKENVEKKIENVRQKVKELVDDFNKSFGFINFDDNVDRVSNNIVDKLNSVESPVLNAAGDVVDEVANFIKNFSITKIVGGMTSICIGATAATFAMDLLPIVDVDKMLREIMSGVDTYRIDKMTELNYNKYYESGPDGITPLSEVPDSRWKLSEDDLEKYKQDEYNKFLEEYNDGNNIERTDILEQMLEAKQIENGRERRDAMRELRRENKQLRKENKSAIKKMRKIRRHVIQAKQIEKYKGFLKTEFQYLKIECVKFKTNIKFEWDSMMEQYKTACKEIKKFFTAKGYGGYESIEICCDRINDDATQIVEMCKNIKTELTNTVTNIAVPYAIGSCVDMPVHKILEFFKDVKIVLTFLKNLILLGIDIISQLTILAKIVANGLQSLAEIFKTLSDLLGVDKIINMINVLVELFKPKMIDAKRLLENSLNPIYYNETEEYEIKLDALEGLLDKEGTVTPEKFHYTDDINNKRHEKKKYIYGGDDINLEYDGDDDDKGEAALLDLIEKFEEKGDREIVAYRTPILTEDGEDFAGWIFFHADAYDNMDNGWKRRKKYRKNKLIKKAAKKNKITSSGKTSGGVTKLKNNKSFGSYDSNGKFSENSVTAYDAYYWYTKWTSDPTDCAPDFSNVEYVYDDEGNLIPNENFKNEVVTPVMTTANGSLVEVTDGGRTFRVFVEGKTVQSGDFVNVNGKKYRVN